MSALRVLLAHNRYRQRGGEDSVVESESALLLSHGVEVAVYSRSSAEAAAMPRLALATQAIWSARTEADIAALVRDFRPHLIHAHNTFPLISPSLYHAAARAGVPLVQTLHNFRLLCANALFLRDGKACQDCLGRVPWRGVWHRCYHASAPESAVLAGTLALHRARGTYHKVARYIALNEFSRAKFIAGGLAAERVVVKPNFVEVQAWAEEPRQGGLFVGRLSAEKGIGVLARAMDRLPAACVTVLGEGPEEAALRSRTGARLHGLLPREQMLQHMRRAAYLLMPSICYENFPLVLVEAYACGLPVIASRLGAMAELIEDGGTGLLFEPGSAEDLARKIAWAEANPWAMHHMGRRARGEYEAKYTPERNYRQLMAIYMDAIAAAPPRVAPR